MGCWTGAGCPRWPRRWATACGRCSGSCRPNSVPGVEEWRDGAYRRTLRLPHGPAVVALAPPVGAGGAGTGHVAAVLRLADLRDLGVAIARCRRTLDLDADPIAVDELLAADP